jgi:hypothetical protein
MRLRSFPAPFTGFSAKRCRPAVDGGEAEPKSFDEPRKQTVSVFE